MPHATASHTGRAVAGAVRCGRGTAYVGADVRRNWFPCRVCGVEHTNPASSSICAECGAAERAARLDAEYEEQRAYEESPLGQFMALSEDERWERVYELLAANNG